MQKSSASSSMPSTASNLPELSSEQKRAFAAALVQRYAPAKIEETLENPLSAFTAYLREPTPTLGVLAAQTSPKVVQGWVLAQLNEAAKQWGEKDNLTSSTLEAVAKRVVAVHYGLTPPEVMLYIAQVLSGYYGKVAYGKLTMDDLLQFLPKFYLQQTAALADYYRREEEAWREREAQRAAKYAVSREVYLETLRRAEAGDEEAKRLLAGPQP